MLIEVYLYTRYAQLGAQFNFWLRGLFGGALGLAALTVLRLVATRRRDRDPASGAVTPWGAGWLGHLYSAVPDVLFLGFGVLHVLWMDVFAFHITLHFIPAPLLTMLALFLLALLAYGLAASRHPRTGDHSRGRCRRPNRRPGAGRTAARQHSRPPRGPRHRAVPGSGTPLKRRT